MKLADWIFVIFLLAAAATFFLPLYFAFTYSPWCLLLFCFTWLPAATLVWVGAWVHKILE